MNIPKSIINLKNRIKKDLGKLQDIEDKYEGINFVILTNNKKFNSARSKFELIIVIDKYNFKLKDDGRARTKALE